jgi:outer membrane protein OmpA-like peptidoglycan-associated protein
MYFQLKPAVRQLSLAFPLLLIALPAALKAADDRLGPALPPPSLYDSPSTPGAPVSTPSTIRPATPASQAAPPPAAQERAPAVQAVPAPAAQERVPVAQPAPTAQPKNTPALTTNVRPVAPAPAARSEEPEKPWYKRWFSWLPGSGSGSAAAPVAPKPAVTADAGAAMGSLNNGSRAEYAYAAPSHAIRTGYGQCVRTGWWTPDAGAAGCEPNLERQQAAVKTPPVVSQANPPRVNGSAPIREVNGTKSDVEVVALPPRPQPTRADLNAAPAKEQLVRDEIVTALAATRPVAEPDLEKLTLSAGALFPLASTSIKPLGREKLDELVSRLKEMDYASVHIVGHSDPTGPGAMNEKLSKRRADAVKGYLVSKGIDAKRIQTEGKGGAQPLPKTRDCDALPRMEKIICYAPDRRVEIEVVGGKPRS